MHFSIPDTRDCREENGSTYLTYNIQANGWAHCSLRYRQLLCLHQQLQRELPNISLPPFPPKKLLPLTASQILDRRIALEKYILAVTLEQRVLLSHHFNGFFACAQHESYTGGGAVEEVPLQVHLMNGQRIVVTGTDAMQAHHLLQLVCQQIGLPLDLMNYFTLFIVRKKDNDLTLVKKLQPFECPYISQKSLRGSHRIVLRKNYWLSSSDYAAEDCVVAHPVGLGLVYGQAVAEVQLGWYLLSQQQHQQLAELQARGHKREYLEVARGLKYYGYVQFSACECDSPAPNTPVAVAAGNYELNFRIVGEDGVYNEGNFKVTRMRCWRVTCNPPSETVEPASPVPLDGNTPSSSNAGQFRVESNRQNSTTSTSSGFSSSHSTSNTSINNSGGGDTDHATGASAGADVSVPRRPVNGSGSNGYSVSSIGNRSSSDTMLNGLEHGMERHAASTPTSCNSALSGYVIGGSVGGSINRVNFASRPSSSSSVVNGNGPRNPGDEPASRTVAAGHSSRGVAHSLSRQQVMSYNGLSEGKGEDYPMMELSFEYLVHEGEMRWVRVFSREAVLMSLCLQSMVHQLIKTESNGGRSSPPDCPAVTEKPVFYMGRDGNAVMKYTHTTRQPRSFGGGLSALGELSFRRLTERLTEMNTPSAAQQQQPPPPDPAPQCKSQLPGHHVENSAFNNITDNHL